MYRQCLVAAILSGACAEIECPDDGSFSCPEDNRPATLEYVQATILRPACSNAQCHSAFTNTGPEGGDGYDFDPLENAQGSLSVIVVPGDSRASFLFTVLTRPGGDDPTTGIYAARMPYDQPLPDADIALIARWIDDGAPGLVIP